MNCPYCGKEMESAYIQSFQQIYLNRGRKPRFNAAGDLSSRSLSRFSLTKAPFVKASYCEDCGKIIVDLKESEKDEKGIRKHTFRRSHERKI
ncbi:MAG: PF20097 family protein [Erysipelotrichaceae bacterium]|jgi:hypothetical protein|nr:hypothetical protein [Erysipelotrichaceae bacterium]MBQ2655275.1 hypothetical protein [Erysipelotrichaceae bacterium]MBQ4020291.1 hypothetical protein [Erysipelotrichaceae bacterium]MBR4484810.1 hypothetical protein [Erysipelotrichaceae bacterium]MEE3409405.1 PF20097 family protein [Erysipelotrichaceae bacterium]